MMHEVQWSKGGCTIMSDRWTDRRGRSRWSVEKMGQKSQIDNVLQFLSLKSYIWAEHVDPHPDLLKSGQKHKIFSLVLKKQYRHMCVNCLK